MNQPTAIGLSLLGYNRQQIDLMLQNNAQRIQQLEEQVTVLQQQLQHTQDQLSKYEAMEEELKAGIIDARITGKNIVQTSQQEAEQMIQQTNEQVAQFCEDIAYQSQSLLQSGTSLKERMNEMKQEMLITLQSYQKLLETTDFDIMYPSDKVAPFVAQVDAIKENSILISQQNAANSLGTSLSEEEKIHLEHLIQEVIDYENEQVIN